MKLVLYSVKDVTAVCFLAPFVSRSPVDAIRQIKASRDDANVKATPLGQYPQDFELWQLGEFDDSTGDLAMLDKHRVASIAELWADRPSSTGST